MQMNDAERLAAVEGCKFVDKVGHLLRRTSFTFIGVVTGVAVTQTRLHELYCSVVVFTMCRARCESLVPLDGATRELLHMPGTQVIPECAT